MWLILLFQMLWLILFQDDLDLKMRKEKQRFERSIRTKEDKIDEQDKTIHRMEKVIKMLQQDLADRKSREDRSEERR